MRTPSDLDTRYKWLEYSEFVDTVQYNTWLLYKQRNVAKLNIVFLDFFKF